MPPPRNECHWVTWLHWPLFHACENMTAPGSARGHLALGWGLTAAEGVAATVGTVCSNVSACETRTGDVTDAGPARHLHRPASG